MLRQSSIITLTFLFTLAIDIHAASPKISLVRRIETTEAELQKELLNTTEVGFNQQTAKEMYTALSNVQTMKGSVRNDIGVKYFTEQISKSATHTMPWNNGAKASRGEEHAKTLNHLSIKLREALRNAVLLRGSSPNSTALRRLVNENEHDLRSKEWQRPEAIPTLMQMLQVEDADIREMLVETLAKIEGKEATVALTHRALFDLSPSIRKQAVQILADRPEEEYRQALLDGLRYPWPAVPDHAAEAIVALNRVEYVGHLVNLLKEPDPRRPRDEPKGKLVQELVRINHMANCLLCHAPSSSASDHVRGLIPTPFSPPPPLYYTSPSGSFARADLTYLRQDFSVVQPVMNSGQWPEKQRYDYLLRTRSATDKEILKGYNHRTDLDPTDPRKTVEIATGLFSERYPEHGAILFALRRLTNKDLGARYEDWSVYARKEDRPEYLNTLDFDATSKRLANALLTVQGEQRQKLVVTYQDSKGREYTEALLQAIDRMPSDDYSMVRTALATRLARMNASTLLDYMRNPNAELRRAAALACGSKDRTHMSDYVDSLIRLLADDSPSVVQASRASLKAFSGKDYGPEIGTKGLDRVNAVTNWQQWWAAHKNDRR